MKKKKYHHNGKRCSKGEKRIAELLDLWQIRYIKEQKFADLKSEKGNCLRFDFYLPDFNLLLEYQGQHHFKPINKYKRAQKTHNQTIIHDKLKREYVNKRNDLNLITIPYNLYNNLDYILTEIIKHITISKSNKKE